MPFLQSLPSDPAGLESRKKPIVVRAVIFIVLVCIALLSVEGWSRWKARSDHLANTQIATSNMARALAQHAENTVKIADSALLGIVERLEAEGMKAADNRMRKFLISQIAELPILSGLFIFGEDGHQIVNSLTTQVNTTASMREYFIYHKNHSQRESYIGQPVRSLSTGDWIITVSRRLNHPDGRFAGVAVATIKLDHFKHFYDSFDIGRKGTILLALTDGSLLVRRPTNEKANRTNIADGPVFQEYRSKGPVGTSMLRARVDNVERLYSYRALGTYPLIVAVALSKDEIFSNWRMETYRNFMAIMLLVGGLALLGYRLIRQIRIREQLEAELRNAKSILEDSNGSLRVLALQDGLTGLANRRHFEFSLMSEFSRAMRNASSLALIMLDVDYFKQYNDIYGHPAGDDCLLRISQAVKAANNRAGDLAARYGGEELAVLLPDTDLDGAMVVAERIREAVKELHIPHAANPAGIVTISAGIKVCVPVKDIDTTLDLVRAADQALYTAKTRGRDQVCCAPELSMTPSDD